MKRMIRYGKISIFLMLLLIISCTGCSVREQESENVEETLIFRLHETAIPDPDEALAMEGLLEGGRTVRELQYELGGSTIYRLIQIWEADQSFEWEWLQILKSPYTKWESYELKASYWDKEAIYKTHTIEQIYVSENEEVYCRVFHFLEDGQDIDSLGLWYSDREGGLLGNITDISRESLIIPLTDKSLYIYEESQRDRLLVFDGHYGGTMEELSQFPMNGDFAGLLENPATGEIYWYGYRFQKPGIWKLQEGSDFSLSLPEVSMYNCQLVFAQDGTLYVGNDQSLWRCREGQEAEKLFDFLDKDYVLTELCGIFQGENGDICLLVSYEEGHHILSLEEYWGQEVEKQPIVLALWTDTPPTGLSRVIRHFNRDNPDYYVELLLLEDEMLAKESRDRIQMEISAGKGPDILEDFMLYGGDYAENGYLMAMDGLLTEEEAVWPVALENCRSGGILYGVPYVCQYNLAAYSRELVGDKESISLSELMEAVRNSNAEILNYQFSGTEIVLIYGLRDNDNTAYIDWEKGESHLTEEPFIELLEFAREYADRGEYEADEVGTLLQSGRIAASGGFTWYSDFDIFNFYDACFREGAACIGYPQTIGNGIFVDTRDFYVNASTEKPEGCVAFLNYLLSREAQDILVTSPGFQRFSVRTDELEKCIALKQSEGQFENVWYGIRYSSGRLSEEGLTNVRFLIESAKPARWNVDDLEEMIYEELEPYFEGLKTAEEVADILDNRVQLYLDERGH